MKYKADISSVCPEPQENPGLQVGKESGICSRSQYWSDDRLTSKARGGEGRGLWFLQCLLGCVGALVGGRGGEGRLAAQWRPQPGLQDGTNEPEERKQLRWRRMRLKSPSPLCIRRNRCGSSVCVCVCARVCMHACACVCWKENRLYSQINLCAYPLSAKPGLWDLEYVLFFFLNLHFLILKNGISDSYHPAWLWLCRVFCKQ